MVTTVDLSIPAPARYPPSIISLSFQKKGISLSCSALLFMSSHIHITIIFVCTVKSSFCLMERSLMLLVCECEIWQNDVIKMSRRSGSCYFSIALRYTRARKEAPFFILKHKAASWITRTPRVRSKEVFPTFTSSLVVVLQLVFLIYPCFFYPRCIQRLYSEQMSILSELDNQQR